MISRTLCFAVLLIVGCAQPVDPPPLATDHPANPRAPEAPLPPRSQTLDADPPATAPGSAPAPAHSHHGEGGHP